MKAFIRWNITLTYQAIHVKQRAYVERLLLQLGMVNCNPVTTPLPSNENLSSRKSHEFPLSTADHHNFVHW